MAKNEVPKGEPFDLEKLQTLFEMMEKHGLTEVNLKRGEETWKLRRGPQETISMVPATHAVPQAVPQPVAAAPAAPAPAPQEATPAADSGPAIKSPTVGTFYSSPSPDDPPFVSVGSKVSADTIVCIVEAMKVFNQIPAELNGTISEVLVKDGEAVEFGQPLFRISQG
ncbi:acetyl-CoA carboxylase biotin carboxyl carrier protein [Gimesia benthica]|uniref:Biotin carboxyl carrier protein of acetyl-CoA carboxylase n=1 Tax=Gimesia benthica TaxID=2608982 RepID=A0A6I6ADH6_9PLAN|nr:acetyl-CoA carboxylase biotin carboxyl carrier protein [Gimesia benthica]QGQ23425.1 acetyl-CoA carboxylase biotin carboxyl carrier protein [Gimesia benthica]